MADVAVAVELEGRTLKVVLAGAEAIAFAGASTGILAHLCTIAHLCKATQGVGMPLRR